MASEAPKSRLCGARCDYWRTVGRSGIRSHAPAIVEGRWQTDILLDDADDLTDLLNRLDREAKAATAQ